MKHAKGEQIRNARLAMGNPYAFLDDTGAFSAIEKVSQLQKELEELLAQLRKNQSDSQLEECMNELLRWAWINKTSLWASPPRTPFELLDACLFLDILGYDVSSESSLGNVIHRGSEIEVGAIIDVQSKRVRYSNSPNLHPRKRRLTLAHELGHACLHSHSQMPLHRDIPIDAAMPGRVRTEQRADKFAALFTMPARLVNSEVEARFDRTQIQLCEQTMFFLGEANLDSYRQSLKHDGHQMALAKTIARTSTYSQRQFVSLAEKFGVSVHAMAIRLIELRVV